MIRRSRSPWSCAVDPIANVQRCRGTSQFWPSVQVRLRALSGSSMVVGHGKRCRSELAAAAFTRSIVSGASVASWPTYPAGCPLPNGRNGASVASTQRHLERGTSLRSRLNSQSVCNGRTTKALVTRPPHCESSEAAREDGFELPLCGHRLLRGRPCCDISGAGAWLFVGHAPANFCPLQNFGHSSPL